MDFEERIDKLTARHKALSQTVELLAHAQTRNEELHAKNEVMQAKNERLITQVIESIDSLARIAHAHEKRISDIEDRPQ